MPMVEQPVKVTSSGKVVKVDKNQAKIRSTNWQVVWTHAGRSLTITFDKGDGTPFTWTSRTSLLPRLASGACAYGVQKAYGYSIRLTKKNGQVLELDPEVIVDDNTPPPRKKSTRGTTTKKASKSGGKSKSARRKTAAARKKTARRKSGRKAAARGPRKRK